MDNHLFDYANNIHIKKDRLRLDGMWDEFSFKSERSTGDLVFFLTPTATVKQFLVRDVSCAIWQLKLTSMLNIIIISASYYEGQAFSGWITRVLDDI